MFLFYMLNAVCRHHKLTVRRPGFLPGCQTSGMLWKEALHVSEVMCFLCQVSSGMRSEVTLPNHHLISSVKPEDTTAPRQRCDNTEQCVLTGRGNTPSSSSSSSEAVNTNPLCLPVHLPASLPCFPSICITTIQPVLFYQDPTPAANVHFPFKRYN